MQVRRSATLTTRPGRPPANSKLGQVSSTTWPSVAGMAGPGRRRQGTGRESSSARVRRGTSEALRAAPRSGDRAVSRRSLCRQSCAPIRLAPSDLAQPEYEQAPVKTALTMVGNLHSSWLRAGKYDTQAETLPHRENHGGSFAVQEHHAPQGASGRQAGARVHPADPRGAGVGACRSARPGLQPTVALGLAGGAGRQRAQGQRRARGSGGRRAPRRKLTRRCATRATDLAASPSSSRR